MSRTSRRVLLLVAAFALFLVPAAAIAAAGFTDVADDNVFVADIEWMKDNEITKGCNPPTNDRFCPGNNVTREQMSAFMHRLAISGVVNAATAVEAERASAADRADLADHALTAESADDAAALDGKAAAEYVTVAAANLDSDQSFHSSSTPIDAATVSITAPTDGVLLIWGGATMWNNAGSDRALSIQPAVDGTLIGLNIFGWAHDIGSTSPADSNVVLSLATATEVTAGVHTVVLKAGVGDSAVGNGAFHINRANLVVQFVANGTVSQHTGIAAGGGSTP